MDRHRTRAQRRGIAMAILALVTLLAAAPPAGARRSSARHPGDGHARRCAPRPVLVPHPGPAHGKVYRYREGRVRYIVVRRPRVVFLRPACVDRFVVRRPRFVVVRPVPCWPAARPDGMRAHLGLNIGGVNLGVAFQRSDPHYGCNFCEAYFDSYGAWEAHVGSCRHAGHARVICEPWERGDVEHFRAGAW